MSGAPPSRDLQQFHRILDLHLHRLVGTGGVRAGHLDGGHDGVAGGRLGASKLDFTSIRST